METRGVGVTFESQGPPASPLISWADGLMSMLLCDFRQGGSLGHPAYSNVTGPPSVCPGSSRRELHP